MKPKVPVLNLLVISEDYQLVLNVHGELMDEFGPEVQDNWVAPGHVYGSSGRETGVL